MMSLENFESSEGTPLFRNASKLPTFFQHNLVDGARVVKVFKEDPQANIRVFYYQYLKLCFELESVDYEGYINKIEQILNNEDFKFIFFEDDDASVFNDLQFKNLIMQFFGILGEGNTSAEQALVRYPIMDTIMIYFFRAILILTGKTDALDSYVERDELIQYLSNYFSVEITFHDRCIKFVETDIFVYEEDPKDVFMAYMDYEQAQAQLKAEPSAIPPPNLPQHFFDEPALQEPLPPPNPAATMKEPSNYEAPILPVSNSSRRAANEINNSYISSDFVDYTINNHNLTSLVNPSNLKESGRLAGGTIIVSGNSIEELSKQSRKRSEDVPKIVISPNTVRTGSAKEVQEQTPSYTDTFTYSSPTNSQSAGYGSLTDKSSTQYATGLSHQTAKGSDHALRDQNKYSLQNEWEPTKDPGFDKFIASNPSKSLNDYQKPASASAYKPPTPSIPTQQPTYPSTSSYKTPSPLIPAYKPNYADNPVPSYHPVSSYTDSFKKDSSYLSNASESSKHLVSKGLQSSEVPKQGESHNQTSSYQQKRTTGYHPQGMTGYQPPGMAAGPEVPAGKNPFNLNVSLEFTNSFTMRAMQEPYRSNVFKIREKARNYRDSLSRFLK